ncbi:hypothetical protein Tco_0499310 [Tanacetum coccineum]
MSQGPHDGYYTDLLNSNPQQYPSPPNPSNPSTPSSQNLNSSSQPIIDAKCEAAYEAKIKKELGFLECRELEFLMIDLESLPPQKAAYIRRKQEEIMKKNIKTLNLSFRVILPPLPFGSAATFANIMCCQPLPPPLSPPSAKLMIMALEEYGYQSRRGIRVPNKWRPSYSGDIIFFKSYEDFGDE